jgi:hypothetical protein
MKFGVWSLDLETPGVVREVPIYYYGGGLKYC